MNLRASGSRNWAVCYTQKGVRYREARTEIGVGGVGSGGRIKIKSKSKIKKKSKRKRKIKITTGRGRRAAETWPPEYVWPWHPRKKKGETAGAGSPFVYQRSRSTGKMPVVRRFGTWA